MKMLRYLSISLIIFGCLSLPAEDKPSKEVLYHDNFDTDLSQWVVEQAKGGSTELKDGKLVINDKKGCTVWFKQKLSGSIIINFDVVMVDNQGENDRVSDLNCFWMATDPNHPDNIFANKTRGGLFKNYHYLKLYYVGYGANNNTTTRFRRYKGGGERPVLPEHDLTDKKFLHTANQKITITIIANGESIQYLRDGEMVYNITDPQPYLEGWFGFRTVRNHMHIDNFTVSRVK